MKSGAILSSIARSIEPKRKTDVSLKTEAGRVTLFWKFSSARRAYIARQNYWHIP